MTHLDRHTARQARIQRVSDGVVASYIHDIAAPAPRRHSRAGREHLAARGPRRSHEGRDPGGSPGPLRLIASAGREVLEAERLQIAVEVELRQPAGQLADAELVQEALELGRRQVHPEAA
jgi:hypothetical protein